jgi:glycosyltransferase involved in cell wall biosynthesis
MRIAWITTGFYDEKKGHDGGAFIHDLACELASLEGADLTIFSLYHPVNKPQYDFRRAKVFSFAVKDNTSKFEKLAVWRRCIRKFKEENNYNKFDIIHSMWAGESGLISSHLSRKHHIPLAVNICGGELAYYPDINYGSRTKFWQKRFVDRSFKCADVIVSGSNFIAGLLKKYYNEEISKKTIIIPFGVDSALFHPEGEKSSLNHPLTLINISNVSHVKDHKTLLKSLLIVREKFPDVMLSHYGKDEKNLLKEMVDKYKLGNNVQLNGFIEYQQIQLELKKADIFVLSSMYESQNMAIIEAAFCGLPVVSTDAGAVREITPNIVPPGDSDSLARMIVKTAENLKEEKKKAVSKIEFLEANFSLKASAQKFLELYRSLVPE